VLAASGTSGGSGGGGYDVAGAGTAVGGRGGDGPPGQGLRREAGGVEPDVLELHGQRGLLEGDRVADLGEDLGQRDVEIDASSSEDASFWPRSISEM
jgi:hypothetical protein